MMISGIKEGKKITFQDRKTKQFVIGTIAEVLNGKESTIQTEDGKQVIVNNKRLRTLKN